MNASVDFASALRRYAEVIVRIGLNLQRGQRLLIAEPYELQGVSREAETLVAAVQAISGVQAEVIWSSPERVRQFAARRDWRGWTRLVADHADLMSAAVGRGDALLFLPGSHPGLLAGLPETDIRELRRIGWAYFGPVAQALMQGATNWTAAPSPGAAWADCVYTDLPAAARLPALWETLFTACRVFAPSPLEAWQKHLAALQQQRDALNARRLRSLRYQGPGTDLTVSLPPAHRWCTAGLRTARGVDFVANLPTEEIFTLPHRDSAQGHVRVSRPIHYAGAIIEGIELLFARGRVIRATATSHQNLLRELLALDDGAARLGEVALLPSAGSLASEKRLFHHPLLDENAAPHIALGEGYGFCLSQPDAAAHNHSLIHVDLALDAQIQLDETELI